MRPPTRTILLVCLACLSSVLSIGCAIGEDAGDPGDSHEGGVSTRDAGLAREASVEGGLFAPEPLEDAATSGDAHPDAADAAPVDDSGCGALTLCGTLCVDTSVHPAHCGKCGSACDASQTCLAGVCTLVCSAGKKKCGTACLDVGSDVANCGDCGKACPGGANGAPSCASGACSFACSAGFAHCEGTTTGCETDVRSNAAHCGSCGNACPAGDSCVSGACVAPVTTVAFPSSTSTTNHGALGTITPYTYFYMSGDYVEQTFARAASASQLDLSLTMQDWTTSYCAVGSLTWNVKVNGVLVGSYSWMGGTWPWYAGGHASDQTITRSFTFAPVASSGTMTVRIEAVSTVCSGGGSWVWNVGSATLK